MICYRNDCMSAPAMEKKVRWMSGQAFKFDGYVG